MKNHEMVYPCWSCKVFISPAERSQNDGDCPSCGVELDPELWPEGEPLGKEE